MSNVEISESDHLQNVQYNDENEIGETYEDKGYSKIPLDQINLNTEPISINNDFSHALFDTNIKSYFRVFIGFIIVIIILFTISILSGHFHYEKVDMNENERMKTENKMNLKQEVEMPETPLKPSNYKELNHNNTLKRKPFDNRLKKFRKRIKNKKNE